jgi:hypothetical protein
LKTKERAARGVFDAAISLRQSPHGMKTFLALFAVLNVAVVPLRAWDYEGHRIVNQLGLASLPTNFPSFVRTPAAAERVAFLAGEPDRWRNTGNPALKHVNGPDHFFDFDELELYGLNSKTASPFRYDFVAQLKSAREKAPDKFPAIDQTKNTDHTRDLIGFLPWTLNEQFAKLEAAFSYLKTFEQFGGTADEITNAQQNIIYVMGVMGHFAGDAAQPLHTTKNFNGWLGANPNRYNTNKTIHSWIDGGFIRRENIRAEQLKPKLRTAKLLTAESKAGVGVFDESMSFVSAQFDLVEKVYQLDRDGKLSPSKGDVTEGHEFISAQLIKGGQFLGDLWFSAWQNAPIDTYLKGELTRRTNAK